MRYSVIKTVKKRIPSKKIDALVNIVEVEEKPPDAILYFIFFQDRDIRKLNRKFRGIDKATDVLSFSFNDELGEDAILGEVYISTDSAARYAAEDRISFGEMIVRLCCHGILHLLGYDHIRRKDRLAMEKRERHILGRVDIQ